MKDMLGRIISVDKMASKSVQEAEREQSEVGIRIEEARKKLEMKYGDEAKKRIEALQKEKKEEFERLEKDVRIKAETLMNDLENRFSEMENEWVEEIVRRAVEN